MQHTQTQMKMQMKLKCKFRPNGKFRFNDCKRKRKMPPTNLQPNSLLGNEWQMKRK